MDRTTMKETAYSAAFIITMALICLYLIQIKLVDTNLITWDSKLGYIMSVTPVIMIIYAVLMIIIQHILITMNVDELEITENIGDWSAKEVHWTDKHKV